MEVKPKVTLMNYTPDGDKLIASAAKLCYSKSDINSIMEKSKDDEVFGYIDNLMLMGHESPFEHITFTFGIEGVSRSMLAQITRHRIASYSVQSQRYVEYEESDGFEYIMPPIIGADPELSDMYTELMNTLSRSYKIIADKIEKKYNEDYPNINKNTARKRAIEDARFILPNATATKIVATFNARSLFNFFKLRCCRRAQWEIRTVAMQMYELVYSLYPSIFAKSGPSCVCAGKCTERLLSCGDPDDVRMEFDMVKDNIDRRKKDSDNNG